MNIERVKSELNNCLMQVKVKTVHDLMDYIRVLEKELFELKRELRDRDK